MEPDHGDHERIRAEIAAENAAIENLERGDGEIITPAEREEIEKRIAAHQATIEYLERQLHNI